MSQILELHNTGLTPAEIVATINAQGRTHRDIDLGELRSVLRSRGMLIKQFGVPTEQKWIGSVVSMRDRVASWPDETEIAPGITAAFVKRQIAVWLAHTSDDKATLWHTTKAEFAAPFFGIVQLFSLAPNDDVFQPGDFDAIYALGGGRVEYTEEDVQRVIAVATEATLSKRATNACALMQERLTATDSAAMLADKWAKAWSDARA